jgi:hypothetical protein
VPDPFETRIDACARMFEAACRESRYPVTGDGRISEECAASLIGLDAKTLANKRAEGGGPKWFRIGGAGHRVSYRLADLAEWVEGRRCE